MLSMDGCSAGYALLDIIPNYSIDISTPLAHPALHMGHFSFPIGAPLFPSNSSYCLSNSILIHCELTSQFQPFIYDKSSEATLEFNFTDSPGSNHSGIQGVPPASLHCWWSACSCICPPWRDGRFSGWHWDYLQLISCQLLSRVIVLVLPASIFESLTIFFGSPQCRDAINRMLNEMLGTIVWFRSW